MNRNVLGTIRKTDSSPWPNAMVQFELERSSYDAESQYPVKPVSVETDENGDLFVSLWCNEESPRPTRYICTMPDGAQFRFNLSKGFFPVSLSELRESAVEDDSPTQSDLVAFLPIVRSEAAATAGNQIAGLSAEIATKADQSALDATDVSVAELADVVNTKASQTALNLTNDAVSDLGLNLDDAIQNLQVAINSAQTLLEGLIDQKADLSHTHSYSDIQDGRPNAIGYFDGDGDLKGSPLLKFEDGKVGLGTTSPQFTLDLSHPGAVEGSQARITADLNSPIANLKLTADPSDPQLASITLDCGGITNSIDSDQSGLLHIGTESVTPAIGFRVGSIPAYFRGIIHNGHSAPSLDDFPDHGSFGIFIGSDFLSVTVFFVVNYDGALFTIAAR